MAHDHAHSHAAGRAEDRRRLILVVAVTASVAIVELVGALLSGSLALLADAGHMFSDTAGLLLALSASIIAARPPNERRTYGYHRVEILAGMINAVVLLVICGYLAYAGVRRMIQPSQIDAPQMLIFAAIGLAANLISLAILTSRKDNSINMKGAYLEVFTDALGSVAAIVAGLVVWSTGFVRADSIASLVIAAMIVPRSISLLREAIGVLLESTPRHLDLGEVRAHLEAMDGVDEVHDLHAWTITSGMVALSAHVVVDDGALMDRGVGTLLDQLTNCAAQDFGIHHVTFQVEPQSHRERACHADHP